MLGRSFNLIPRGDIAAVLACVTLSLVLLFLPATQRVLVADRLGLVLTAPYWRARNFGEDVLRSRDRMARLEKRAAELELALDEAQRLQRDAARLAGPALDAGYSGDLVPCRVVMRQRGRFATMVKVEAMSPVDWRPWQPVVSRAGYLGRLSVVVNRREAWVELISAPDFALGVELERTGLLGIMRPRGERYVMEMVGRDADVRPGDRIITSGIAEIREGGGADDGGMLTPRGFPVGTVADAATPADGVFKEIVVTPAASVDVNETVFVVVPLDGGPAKGARP